MWINVNNQMPPRSKEIEWVTEYVIVTNGKLVGHGNFDYDMQCWNYDMVGKIPANDNLITYWKPLPEPPNSGDVEAEIQKTTNKGLHLEKPNANPL